MYIQDPCEVLNIGLLWVLVCKGKGEVPFRGAPSKEFNYWGTCPLKLSTMAPSAAGQDHMGVSENKGPTV